MVNGLELPISGTTAGTAFASTGQTINISGSTNTAYVGVVFVAYENATITHLAIALRSRTGNPGTMRLEIRQVSGTGVVDTAVAALASTATLASSDASWNYNADATWSIQALTASFNIVAGTYYAVILKSIGGTWDASNLVTTTAGIAAGQVPHGISGGFYGLSNGSKTNIGTAVALTGSNLATAKAYGRGTQGWGNINTGYRNTTMFGNQFSLPASFGNSVEMVGVTHWGLMNTPANEVNTFRVYTVSGGVATQIYSEDYPQPIGVAQGNQRRTYYFTTPVTLTPGTIYIYAVGNPLGDQIQTQYWKSADYTTRGLMSGYYFGNLAGVTITAGTNAVTDSGFIYCINPIINSITGGSGGGGNSITASFNQWSG